MIKHFLFILCIFAGLYPPCARAAERPWDTGWRFHPGDVPGAQAAAFADADWRAIQLPHDWGIEGKTNPDEPAAGGGGFFPTGIGWYRKIFTAASSWGGKLVWIEFDGVYRHSEVWINGISLGVRPNGFVPFRYEISAHLAFDHPNVIAVRVDNSAQPNSRYYTGSGINRHVRLRIVDPLHFEPDSLVVVTDQLSAESARLTVNATLVNSMERGASATVQVHLTDHQGHPAGTASDTRLLDAGASRPFALELSVAKPHAWSPDTPALYTASFELISEGKLIERADIPVGLRTIRVSSATGFELNGTPLKLLGGNVHDDNGPLGTAAFDRAEERRAELLKASGFNAVRTAHNPPAPAFLAACDRLGLLVIDEAFDGWKKKKLAQDYSRDFDVWWQRDLDAMILRDRNHPSVVMWDIGNEPYERGSPSGAIIAHSLADRARMLDPSRPVTAAINGLGKTRPWSGVDPVMAALDVAGYNYELAHHTDDHARLPGRVMMVSESYQTDIFADRAVVHDAPYVIGDFVWSAMDYLGEAGIGRVFPPDEPVRPHWEGSHFPWHGAATGDIDLTGFRKPGSHYRAIVWDRGEKLYAAVRMPTADGRPWNVSLWAPPPLLASWTWPGDENRELAVEVFSGHEAVRLYLNEQLIGEQPTGEATEFKAVFRVSYARGILRAVGIDRGHETETFQLETAGRPTRLRLTADRTLVQAGGEDLSFLTLEVLDATGQTVPDATNAIEYTVSGPAKIAAIGSADLMSTETYRANPRHAFRGRSLLVIRTGVATGDITVTATSPRLSSATAQLHSVP
ncbi:MAG TPA: glycoside hydrolase family 2 TIM barrel-domain containing protein [Lacunisphaera sp.]|jgi:beta-galactosidase